MTKVDYEYAIKAYQQGQSCRTIAQRFGVGESSVSIGLRRRGVLKKQGIRKYELLGKDLFRRLYIDEKLSIGDIAKKLRMSMSTVGTALMEFKIPTRSHPESAKLTFDNGKRKRTYSRITQGGYVELTIPDYPGARAYGRVFEHLVVWEKANGKLPNGWVIHHLNGIKVDNRPENLAAFPRGGHTRIENCSAFKKRIRELENELRKLKSQGKLETD